MPSESFEDEMAIANARQAQAMAALAELEAEANALSQAAFALLDGFKLRGVDDGTAVLNLQGIINTISVMRLIGQR